MWVRVRTASVRLIEAVLTGIHNLCFEQKFEKYQNFLVENFYFLVVTFSVYLKRHVFVMKGSKIEQLQQKHRLGAVSNITVVRLNPGFTSTKHSSLILIQFLIRPHLFGQHKGRNTCINPFTSILHKSIAGRYRPFKVADGPITARHRFIKNASWTWACWTRICPAFANSVAPDQLASSKASRSGSALFVFQYVFFVVVFFINNLQQVI